MAKRNGLKRLKQGIWLDFMEGFWRHAGLLAAPWMAGALFFADFYRRVCHLAADGAFGWAEMSFGDCFVSVFGGMLRYQRSLGQPFHFPTTWMAVEMLGLFLTLHYPLKDLRGVGRQTLVSINGRTAWWLSKCLWNVWITLYYHGALVLAAFLLCRLFGLSPDIRVNTGLLCVLFNIGDSSELMSVERIPVLWMLLLVAAALALHLFQMTLSLFVRPLWAFLGMSVYLLLSSYLFSPCLLGEYTMLLRGDWIFSGGMSLRTGYGFAAAVLAASVLAGGIKFKKYYDVL